MIRYLRVVVVVVGLMMLTVAIGFMFAPAAMEPDFGLVASRIYGLGTLRAIVGGAFLMASGFTFYGACRGNAAWLLVPLLFLSALLLGRVVHIVVDGLSEPTVYATIIEVTAVAFLLYARQVLSIRQKEEQSIGQEEPFIGQKKAQPRENK